MCLPPLHGVGRHLRAMCINLELDRAVDLDHHATELAAGPGLLYSAVRHVRGEQHTGVGPHSAGLDTWHCFILGLHT